MANESLKVVLGGQRYEVQRRWGKLPPDLSWGFVSQVAVNSSGQTYLLQRANPPVLIFNPQGSYVGALGEDDVRDGHGIYVAADDRVFIVDRDAHEIRVYDKEHRLALTLGRRSWPTQDGPFNHPTGVAVAPDGEIYVSDGYGNACVHRFSPQGELLGTWGQLGAQAGEFSTPHAVLVTQSDQVLVADRENCRVQVFSRDGTFITSWLGFHNPMDLFEDRAGRIYVTDQVPRIHVLTNDGTPLGRCRGAINGAHGISGDREGNLFLAELAPERLTRLALIA